MENTAIPINVIRVLNVLKKRWYIVLFLLLACGFASHYYTSNFVTKSYRATVKMYVSSKENPYTLPNGQTYTPTQTAGDLSLRTLLINDCLEAVKLQDVVDKVNKGLKNEGISRKISSGNISSTVSEGTRFFYVSVTTNDPELCNSAIKLLANASLDKIDSLLQVDNVQVVDYIEAGGAISPNVNASTRNGALIGLAIGLGIMVLMSMADRTIKDEEEFNGLFGNLNIPVIGSIPEFNLSAERSAANKARKTAQRSNRQQQPGRSIADDIGDFSGGINGSHM